VETFSLHHAFEQAIAHQQAGELRAAERLYRRILQRKPAHPDANHNLGMLAITVNKPDLALPFLKTAWESNPNQDQFWFSYLEGLIRANQWEIAQSVIRAAEQRDINGPQLHALNARVIAGVQKTDKPGETEINHVVTLFRQGNFEQVEKQARDLTNRFPMHGFGWIALGAALADLGRTEESLAAKIKAAELSPHDADNLYNLGNSYKKLKRYTEAEHALRQAIAGNENHDGAHNNLALMLQEQGESGEAEKHYRHAIAIVPDNADYYFNLGNTLQDMKRFIETERVYRQALDLNPRHAKAYMALGGALTSLGRLEEARDCYKSAKTLNPNCEETQKQALFNYTYASQYSREFLLSEAKRYGEIVAGNVKQRYSRWQCEPRPQRLRVGFVSGDFRTHSVGYFLEAVLKHLRHAQLDMIGYSTCNKNNEDEVTVQLKSCFTAWKSLFDVDDESAAREIQADGVHILIDLSGHSRHNRLPLFAWKPAPIQVTWLGYLATTGVAEMDYIIGDPFATPPEDSRLFTEKVWCLPQSFQCFTPPPFSVEVGRLPALENGYITFGCFNNLTKINDAVIALWAKILVAVPGSKLFLKTEQFGCPDICERTLQRFSAQGIEANRLLLEGGVPERKDLMVRYHAVDIALDPFPYPGVTTSVESLWMGVPVLTLKGNSFLSRAGESIAHNSGQSNWIATDSNDYLRKAIYFAHHIKKLAQLRQRLRTQVLASPIFDAPQFAHHFENALQQIWHEYQSK
jgi:predicted O-linked N-acetylglucosamine transferase (SPINDLY family)